MVVLVVIMTTPTNSCPPQWPVESPLRRTHQQIRTILQRNEHTFSQYRFGSDWLSTDSPENSLKFRTAPSGYIRARTIEGVVFMYLPKYTKYPGCTLRPGSNTSCENDENQKNEDEKWKLQQERKLPKFIWSRERLFFFLCRKIVLTPFYKKK